MGGDPNAAESGSPRLHTGDRIGPYVIFDIIGSGGMGEVYRARDERLERDVAIKRLSVSAIGGDDVRVPLESDAGLYNCQGPVDAAVDAALGRKPANNSPAELGARTVEILEASYRSAASGVLETVKTLDRSPA